MSTSPADSPSDRTLCALGLAITIAAGVAAIGSRSLGVWALEVIEMLLAVTGRAAGRVDAQGDIWDPEWDMFFCFCGTTVALVALSRTHDRWIRRNETSVDQVAA